MFQKKYDTATNTFQKKPVADPAAPPAPGKKPGHKFGKKKPGNKQFPPPGPQGAGPVPPQGY